MSRCRGVRRSASISSCSGWTFRLRAVRAPITHLLSSTHASVAKVCISVNETTNLCRVPLLVRMIRFVLAPLFIMIRSLSFALRRIAARDWRERRGTRNQGLHVAPAALGLPVVRLGALAEFLTLLLALR